jgi:hypothetical protein
MVRIGGGVFPHIKEPDYLVSCELQYTAQIISVVSDIETLNLYSDFQPNIIARGMVNTVLMHRPLQLC